MVASGIILKIKNVFLLISYCFRRNGIIGDGENGEKILRALDLKTGKVVWEYPQTGSASSWGGVLSTDGGLVFFGEDSGAFAAVDAKTGKPLWHFQTSQLWKASPMTYSADGKQFVSIAAGSSILAFGLP